MGQSDREAEVRSIDVCFVPVKIGAVDTRRTGDILRHGVRGADMDSESAAEKEKKAQERRKLKRRHLIYYLRVSDLATNEVIGVLVDVTTEGLMLMSATQIPVGRDYRLEICWQESPKHEVRIQCPARSLWCRPDVNPSYWDTGFTFNELSRDGYRAIRRMIEDLGFVD
jgi:hypothetical protein